MILLAIVRAHQAYNQLVDLWRWLGHRFLQGMLQVAHVSNGYRGGSQQLPIALATGKILGIGDRVQRLALAHGFISCVYRAPGLPRLDDEETCGEPNDELVALHRPPRLPDLVWLEHRDPQEVLLGIGKWSQFLRKSEVVDALGEHGYRRPTGLQGSSMSFTVYTASVATDDHGAVPSGLSPDFLRPSKRTWGRITRPANSYGWARHQF